ncbi:hypothetical protein E5675_16330 [Sphingopyxis sp. PAMC25046]|uniref:asparagine synthase-related protein n=1 Tax=Sphingopyxis sp. PAMC25046 TaxID=2565556 RepID=UPI00109DD718|nr:asparagine synthase-related protein [Sphingopyxis sp. PAMC25046]QCB55844.1 hypothetical protein E5675_16330 [Sphingopyxis sp. PAMC25046]
MSHNLAIETGWDEASILPPGLKDYGRLGKARIVGTDAQPLSLQHGLLLAGYAFRRQTFSSLLAIDRADAQRITSTDGKWAIDNLWGNYLLAWVGGNGSVRILRSPSTGPALYHHAGSGSACIFTDLALARALGHALTHPDPAALDAHLRFPLLRGPATGLTGVREILAGEIAALGEAGEPRCAWSPWSYVGRRPRVVAPEELREVVQSVVAAWASRFPRVQLELSGGLDSSIVAVSLGGRPDWRAVNLATEGASGDERIYARAAAQAAGAPLVEIMLPGDAGDPLALPEHVRVRPAGFGLLRSSNAALLKAARDYGADAIFSGAGGDNIFGYIRRVGPVIDAFRFAGVRSGMKAAADLADLTGDSLWRALRLAARRCIVRPPDWPADSAFLSARYATSQPPHPWLASGRGVSAGQFGYGRAMLPIQPFLDGYDRALEMPMIAPLLSQPLAEFGLSVATWQWSAGGHDRSLARAAFAELLPPIVRDRRTKGRVDSLFAPAFDANRPALRQFLLGGWLAAAGILDSDAIDAALHRPANALDAVYIRLLQIADVERWVRSL